MDDCSDGACGPVAVVERPSAALIVRLILACAGAVALPFAVVYAAQAFGDALTAIFVAHHLGF